ncbi:MAG: glycosyltransferase [Chitinophagaceae bacterium]
MNLPKVLIIGQPFTKNTGGGITLSNLFAGWPREKVAVTCSPYILQDNIETDTCNTYYQLGYKEGNYKFPFSIFNRKHYSGLLSFNEEKKSSAALKKKPLRTKIIMNVVQPVLRSAGITERFFVTTLSREFCKWLDDFNPEIIYAQSSSLDGLRFCSLVQAYLNKPMVFHMMDDWPSTIATNGIFKKKLVREVDREFRNLMGNADLLMSISDEMAREYKQRYNKTFVTFHNPIDLDFWKKYQRTSYELADPPTIMYAGRIGLGIQDSLKTIAKAVEKVNTELKSSIKFVLQTAEKPGWADEFSCVSHKSFVPYNELPKAFAEADLLILPYDFSIQSIRYIKLSMPTKASEFMASGTPIIIFAPKETAVAAYAQQYNWAELVTEKDIDTLAGSIKHLIEDKDYRKKLSVTAAQLAEKNHSSVIVRKQFQEMICETAKIIHN